MTEGDAGLPPALAFWVQGAPDETRDAHYRAVRWSHALPWQIDRLYEARRLAMESDRSVREQQSRDERDNWPFYRMDAEVHFALVAARQLLRALRAFDGNDRLPQGLTNAQVRDVRDAIEHWDNPDSRAANSLRAAGADPWAHQWTASGPGLLGDVVRDAVLRQWAVDVHAELQRWDPYDGWE